MRGGLHAWEIPNKNLLGNWYFADPIDQRQGYVVPPDTQYYSDTGLATSAGTVTSYTTANPGNGTYGTITVSGTTYYVSWSAAVRGYVGTTYTVDRWRVNSGSGTHAVLVGDGCVSVVSGTDTSAYRHLMESLPAGAYTFSFLTDSDLRSVTLNWDGSTSVEEMYTGGAVRLEMFLSYPTVTLFTRQGNTNKLIAAKLELGDKQTLARQDENGNWVLIDPPPKKGAALAECQRYQLAITSPDIYVGKVGSNTTLEGQVFIPTPVTMIKKPAFVGNTGEYRVNSPGKSQVPNSIHVSYSGSLGVILAVTFSDEIERNSPFIFQCPNGLTFLDANL